MSLQPLERALYLMAAMTGLRTGELLGLRWQDLDRDAHKVRVRQSFVRGEFKQPKSLRGSRGVPLSEALRTALDGLRARSSFLGDEDLVFGHPDNRTVQGPAGSRFDFNVPVKSRGVG